MSEIRLNGTACDRGLTQLGLAWISILKTANTSTHFIHATTFFFFPFDIMCDDDFFTFPIYLFAAAVDRNFVCVSVCVCVSVGMRAPNHVFFMFFTSAMRRVYSLRFDTVKRTFVWVTFDIVFLAFEQLKRFSYIFFVFVFFFRSRRRSMCQWNVIPESYCVLGDFYQFRFKGAMCLVDVKRILWAQFWQTRRKIDVADETRETCDFQTTVDEHRHRHTRAHTKIYIGRYAKWGLRITDETTKATDKCVWANERERETELRSEREKEKDEDDVWSHVVLRRISIFTNA